MTKLKQSDLSPDNTPWLCDIKHVSQPVYALVFLMRKVGMINSAQCLASAEMEAGLYQQANKCCLFQQAWHSVTVGAPRTVLGTQ